jgi:Coenzyme PQQ synthesis protein D (PqqD)
MTRHWIDTERVTWEVTDGEAVIVQFESSAYYALNPSGTYVWSLLAKSPAGVEELTEKIAVGYGKAPGEIAADIEAFVESLKAEGLVIEQAPGNGAPPHAPDKSPPNGSYQPPQLTRFGELEKLILSGE